MDIQIELRESKIWGVLDLLIAAKKMLCEEGKLTRWGGHFATCEVDRYCVTDCDPNSETAFAFDAIGAILKLGGPFHQAKLAMTYLDRAIKEATISLGIFDVGHAISSTQKSPINPEGKSIWPMTKEYLSIYFDAAIEEAKYEEEHPGDMFSYRAWRAFVAAGKSLQK